LSLTIFVQERERGRFNRARDGASEAPGRARKSIEGATAEYGERPGSTEGARLSTARATGKRCPDADLQKPVRAQMPFWVLGYSCPAVLFSSLLPGVVTRPTQFKNSKGVESTTFRTRTAMSKVL
jgi:hypothetical protein